MENDKLKEIANYYKEKLAGKSFKITAKRKEQIVEIKVRFAESNFKHLTGIHYLSDSFINNMSSVEILSKMNKGLIEYKDLAKSQYFPQIQLRLDNFQKIDSVIDRDSNLVASRGGYFNNIKADFVIYKNTSDKRIEISNLFIKEVGRRGFYVPVSYFITSNPKFENSNMRWNIESIEEIKLPEKEITSQNELIITLVKSPLKEAEELNIENTLERFQKLVGGEIYDIPIPKHENTIHLIANDKAELLKLEANIYIPENKLTVAGPIIVVGVKEDGSARSLTDEEMEFAKTYLKEYECKIEAERKPPGREI